MTAHENDEQQITVGVDGSSESRAALRWAVEHARAGDSITLVHVWSASPAMVDVGLCDQDDDAAARGLAHREVLRARELLQEPDVTVQSVVLHGDPRRELCGVDTDLLVVGSRGRGGFAKRLLGTVSEHVVRHAHVPVVVVPSARRRDPSD
jgi:nucleotide-binding universal stress UspA family protein